MVPESMKAVREVKVGFWVGGSSLMWTGILKGLVGEDAERAEMSKSIASESLTRGSHRGAAE